MNRPSWLRGDTVPPLVVTVGAVAATAHGGFEVALASLPAVTVLPWLVAGLYPLITDGLALVAYIAARRLVGLGQAYAWVVTVVAAGLSGLAQAVFVQSRGYPDVSGWLGFGIGYWPAVAGLLAAHLVYLQREHVPGQTLGDSDAPKGQVDPPADPEDDGDAEPVPTPDPVPYVATRAVTEPVIRPLEAAIVATRPTVDLTKTIAPAVRAALSDTERQGLMRVVRDGHAAPLDRIEAVRSLGLGRTAAARALAIAGWQARRVFEAKDITDDQAAIRLRGYITPGQKEATR